MAILILQYYGYNIGESFIMSWFQNVFGPVLRVFGVGKKKDRHIPEPLPGSNFIAISGASTTDRECIEREAECISAIRGYVREPFQIHDREIVVHCVTWEKGGDFFRGRGNEAGKWPKSRTGMFYPPKFGVRHGLIQLIKRGMDQPDRVFLALHEMSHAIWHWSLTSEEWYEWQRRNRSHEDFADDLARLLLGEKLSKEKAEFFRDLENRLIADGSKSQRS
jgi:hypothetical protein